MTRHHFSNRQLILPYAAPYLAYVFIATFFGTHLSIELNYLLRIVLSASLLFWAWKWYYPVIKNPSPLHCILPGIIYGLVGLAIWLVFLTPFVNPEDAKPWTGTEIALRCIAASLFVPIFEELLMRGFLFRFIFQLHQNIRNQIPAPLLSTLDEASINSVKPGEWSWAAVIFSTAIFASGHQIYEWPAAIAYGLLMAWILIRQKEILTCIIAHGITNASLACYIIITGHWEFW